MSAFPAHAGEVCQLPVSSFQLILAGHKVTGRDGDGDGFRFIRPDITGTGMVFFMRGMVIAIERKVTVFFSILDFYSE